MQNFKQIFKICQILENVKLDFNNWSLIGNRSVSNLTFLMQIRLHVLQSLIESSLFLSLSKIKNISTNIKQFDFNIIRKKKKLNKIDYDNLVKYFASQNAKKK